MRSASLFAKKKKALLAPLFAKRHISSTACEDI
jgi:hypothetical protein